MAWQLRCRPSRRQSSRCDSRTDAVEVIRPSSMGIRAGSVDCGNGMCHPAILAARWRATRLAAASFPQCRDSAVILELPRANSSAGASYDAAIHFVHHDHRNMRANSPLAPPAIASRGNIPAGAALSVCGFDASSRNSHRISSTMKSSNWLKSRRLTLDLMRQCR